MLSIYCTHIGNLFENTNQKNGCSNCVGNLKFENTQKSLHAELIEL